MASEKGETSQKVGGQGVVAENAFTFKMLYFFGGDQFFISQFNVQVLFIYLYCGSER